MCPADGQKSALVAVDYDDICLGREPVAHIGNVLQVDGRGAHSAHREVVEPGHHVWAGVDADGVFLKADLHRTRRRDEVLPGNGGGHVAGRQLPGKELLGVEIDDDLALFTAERKRQLCAAHRRETRPKEVRCDVVDLLLGQRWAGDCELENRGIGRAVLEYAWGRRAGRKGSEKGLRRGGDLGDAADDRRAGL